MQVVSFRNVGPPNTPHEIKQMRRQVMDMFTYLGNPVVHKHRWSPRDVDAGLAKTCPACWDEDYGQVRQDCPVCFGVGYVDLGLHPTKFIDANGRLTLTDTGVEAPLYGGFGQPYVTWIAEPDVAFDVFKITEEGIFQRIANATAVAPWFPEMNDNDLLIDVELSHDQATIQDDRDRYELKQSQQITIRGWGLQRQRSRREHLVQQSFQMSLLDRNHHFYDVPLDTL